MRLKPQARSRRALGGIALFACLCASLQAKPTSNAGPSDVLGPLVVEATRPEQAGRQLLRVAIEPSVDSSIQDVLLHSIVKRDFDSSGEFELIEASTLPSRSQGGGASPEMNAWRSRRVEAVVRLETRSVNGRTTLAGEVFLVPDPTVAFREERSAGAQIRLSMHHLADALIGALTGHRGGFASRLTFVRSVGRSRQVFLLDADGHNLRRASTHELVSAAEFGPKEALFHAASVDNGRYQLWQEGYESPRQVVPSGSIYSMTWNDERSEKAFAIAWGTSIGVFVGAADASELSLHSKTEMALHPAFSPTGQLAYVGVSGGTSRIYLDNHPVSPVGVTASAPVFCNHPAGTRLIYSVGAGKRTQLTMSDERGGMRRRLTQGSGFNGYAACSPDGRLVAFFSTRTNRQGPGLYVMPLYGGQARRLSTVLGDSLRWSRTLPP